MKDTQAEVAKMKKQMEKWGAQLDELSGKLASAGAKAKEDEQRVVADLVTKRDAMQHRLDELASAGSEKWESFKTGIHNAYDELHEAFKKLGD